MGEWLEFNKILTEFLICDNLKVEGINNSNQKFKD